MAISQIAHPLPPLASFSMGDSVRMHAPCLFVKRIQIIPFKDKRRLLYDSDNEVDRLSAIDGWVKE